jgi:hypothetical protein
MLENVRTISYWDNQLLEQLAVGTTSCWNNQLLEQPAVRTTQVLEEPTASTASSHNS